MELKPPQLTKKFNTLFFLIKKQNNVKSEYADNNADV